MNIHLLFVYIYSTKTTQFTEFIRHKNMKELIQELQQDELFNKILSISTLKNYSAGTLILKEGDVNTQSFYLKAGLARTFYYKIKKQESIDTTTWFFGDGEIMSVPSSYVLGLPSPESIELLEDSSLMVVNKEDIEKLYQTEPQLNYQGRILAEHAMAMMDMRVRATIMLDAKERYLAFIQQFGYLENRLFDKHIASFLSMSPETLSRIKRLHRRNQSRY
jgi:CRP-like cAMP-binding protein